MPHKITIWTDINISPSIAKWLNENYHVDAISFYMLNLQTASDYDIFMLAKKENVILLTKDKDFTKLLATFNAPPYLLLLKTGNVSNQQLKELLVKTFEKCLNLIIKHNYNLVEII